MNIRRETDPVLLNRLSNDPAVLATLPNLGTEIDWSPMFGRSDYIAFSNGEDGAQIFEQTDDRDWQVVTIFGPTCRGKRALETAYAIKEEMAPLADIVFGPVPNRLLGAQWFYRKLGGVPVNEVVSGGFVHTANPGDTLYLCKVTH